MNPRLVRSLWAIALAGLCVPPEVASETRHEPDRLPPLPPREPTPAREPLLLEPYERTVAHVEIKGKRKPTRRERKAKRIKP